MKWFARLTGNRWTHVALANLDNLKCYDPCCTTTLMDSCDACLLFAGLPVQFQDYQLQKYTKLRTVFEFLFRRKYSNKTHNCITGINKLMAQIGYDTHGIKTPDALRLAVFDQSLFNAVTD